MRERIGEQTRPGVTLHFTITDSAGRETDGYLTTGEYADGRLGEVFVKTGKAGSSAAMLDQWAIGVSMAIQYGAPLSVLLGKHVGTLFEPAGAVEGVEGIRRCTSPLDLICRYLLRRYGEVAR